MAFEKAISVQLGSRDDIYTFVEAFEVVYDDAVCAED